MMLVCGLSDGHLHHLCPAPLLTPDDAVHQNCLLLSQIAVSVRLAVPGLSSRPEPGRFFPGTGPAPLSRSAASLAAALHSALSAPATSDPVGFHQPGAGPFPLGSSTGLAWEPALRPILTLSRLRLPSRCSPRL